MQADKPTTQKALLGPSVPMDSRTRVTGRVHLCTSRSDIAISKRPLISGAFRQQRPKGDETSLLWDFRPW